MGVITHRSVALVNGVVYYMTAGCGNGTTCDTLLYFIYFREVTCTRWNGHDWVDDKCEVRQPPPAWLISP